jgi:hypothetical protein
MVPHMLPSTLMTVSVSANFRFRGSIHTPLDCCVRFTDPEIGRGEIVEIDRGIEIEQAAPPCNANDDGPTVPSRASRCPWNLYQRCGVSLPLRRGLCASRA